MQTSESMSDRDKFLKHEKSDLIIFCESKSMNTEDCFAKIDFVNSIIKKGYKYTDFNKKKPNTNSTTKVESIQYDSDKYHNLSSITDANNGIFEFAVISDQDKASKLSYDNNDNKDDNKDDNERVSYLQHGTIKFNVNENKLENISFNLPSYIDKDSIDNKCIDQETLSIILKCDFVDSKKQRGAEFSALNRFTYDNLQWILCGDDRTGIIFEISKQFKLNLLCKIVEKITDNKLECSFYDKDYVAKNGEICNEQGMKIEWMTSISNELLYIGSNGLEVVDWETRKLTPAHTFVCTFSKKEMKLVETFDWKNNFNVIRKAVGAVFPGWMTIETIIWSNIHKKWFIVPRFLSFAPFNNLLGNYGCNILVIATESFDKCDVVHIKLNKPNDNNVKYVESLYRDYSSIGHQEMDEYKHDFEGAKTAGIMTVKDVNESDLIKTQTEISKSLFYSSDSVYGFSDAQFLPHTNDSVIIGLRSKEDNKKNKLTTTLCIFDINGNVFIQDYPFKGNRKYEGLVVF